MGHIWCRGRRARTLSAAVARRNPLGVVAQDRTAGAEARPTSHRRDPRRRRLWAARRARRLGDRKGPPIRQVHGSLLAAPLREMTREVSRMLMRRSHPPHGVASPASAYFTCTSDVKRRPFVSGLKTKATTAITAPMIVPYSMGWGNPIPLSTAR